MLPLIGKNVVVIGGSRGVGRRVVEAAIGDGARVLAVARQEERLRQLAREVQGVEVLALDATEQSAPSRVFDVLRQEWVDPLSAGIVDPLSVALAALETSVSMARLALSAEVLIRRKNAPRAVAP